MLASEPGGLPQEVPRACQEHRAAEHTTSRAATAATDGRCLWHENEMNPKKHQVDFLAFEHPEYS